MNFGLTPRYVTAYSLVTHTNESMALDDDFRNKIIVLRSNEQLVNITTYIRYRDFLGNMHRFAVY